MNEPAISKEHAFASGWYFIQAEKDRQNEVHDALKHKCTDRGQTLAVIDLSDRKAFQPTTPATESPSLHKQAEELATSVAPLLRQVKDNPPDVLVFKGFGNGLFWAKLLNPLGTFKAWAKEHKPIVVGIMANRPHVWSYTATVEVQLQDDGRFRIVKDTRERET